MSSSKRICSVPNSAGVNKINLEYLYEMKKKSKKEIVEWCMSLGVIGNEYVCPECGDRMSLHPKKASDSLIWVCRKYGVNAHHLKRSVRKGSWFEDSNMTLIDVLTLTYLFVKDTSNEWIVDETGISEPTVLDWMSVCREVCIDLLVSQNEVIGGEGVVVDIDESQFCKRKHTRARGVDGNWVFSGIERGSRRSFFCVVEDRTAETLIEITKKFVKPGSTVVANCLCSFDALTEQGYMHDSANNSENSKDQVTGVHTNGIEGAGSGIKSDLKGKGTNKVEEQFDSYLAECLWRRKFRGVKKQKLFMNFLEGIKQLYPPFTRDPEH